MNYLLYYLSNGTKIYSHGGWSQVSRSLTKKELNFDYNDDEEESIDTDSKVVQFDLEKLEKFHIPFLFFSKIKRNPKRLLKKGLTKFKKFV